MQTTTSRSNRGFWVVPGVGIAIGVAYLVAASVAGDVQLGLTMFAIMAAVTVGLVVASRRSETVRGLLDRSDERITSIDVEATAFAGGVLIVAVIGGMVVELARGNDPEPYAWLGGVAGVAYVVALVVLRFRR